MKKAILFDLDGTLCNFDGVFEDIFMEAMEEVLKDYSELTYEKMYPVWCAVLKKDGALSAESALKDVLEVVGVEKEYDLSKIAEKLTDLYAPQVKLVDEVGEVLTGLKDQYKLALITNGPFDMQKAVIDMLDIGHFFDAVVISGDPKVAVRKPDKQIFKIMLDKLKVQPHDAIMVGDSYEKDLVGAEEFGIDIALVSKKPEECDCHIISTIHELGDILEDL